METFLTTSSVFIFLLMHFLAHANVYEGCQSPQFLELGETGTIQCSFQEGYFGLYWYNSTDTVTEEPFLNLKGSTRSGIGYHSGEFNIHPNGSLIVNHVTIFHNHNFSVVKLNTRDDHPTPHIVDVVTTAHPKHDFPLIENCMKEERLCFMDISQSTRLTCVVKDARPMAELTWATRISTGDQEIPFATSVTNDSARYTSRITTLAELNSTLSLVLYVCKSTNIPPLLVYPESFIIAEKSSRDFSSAESVTRYFQHKSEMNLKCSKDNYAFLVWKKIRQVDDEYEESILCAFVKGTAETTLSEDVRIDEEGTLVITDVDVRHEGTYTCIFSDRTRDFVNVYNVLLYVIPDPPYPIVLGCETSRYCAIDIENGGSLTCLIKGIRPEVQLEWNPIYDTTSDEISFFNEKTSVKNNGETFDITITTQVLIQKPSGGRLAVECKVTGPNADLFDLSTNLDLLLVDAGISITTTSPIDGTRSPSSIVIIQWVLLVPVGLLLGGVVGILLFKMKKRRKTIHEELNIKEGENVPMVDPKITELKKIFVEQLKVKYQTLYDAVQPIPYIKDKLYCVDSVYVERGIEVMTSTDKTGRKDDWETLDSYHNLLPQVQITSTRSVLEGEAGYGKSTLALQLAYDWCNCVNRSPLKNVEVLIILRLRQLGGISSIYRAIRQFLLPKDSELQVSDIENIIQKTSSIVVILDGYDEYPDQDNVETDIMHIIQRDMFQQIHVILTTRSSCIPGDCAPQTRRIRLTGFDETARDKYIRKAVAGNDDTAAKNIKQRLIENPVLGDLCQVPLFFVMFAHMTHERKEFESFNSVTSFFTYMISCFHSHMQNKMRDKNAQFNNFEANHKALDKIALDGLCEERQRLVWNKDEFSTKLGQEVYEYYVKLGILVEEDVLDMEKGPEVFQYKTKVRFYHKIFCEWYAAHILAEQAVSNPVTDFRETLKKLDPYDLHYVYRFACGLKPSGAENILQYLKSIRDGEQFSVLCVLEQLGKIDNIAETVADLCSDVVVIANRDNKLQLRSTVQLLEIASSNAISIACVSIENCFQSVDLDAWNISIGSGLCFSNLSSVKELRINEMGRELTTSEIETIFKFANQCLELHTLRFDCCFLPRSLALKKSETDLNPNEIEVQWIPTASWFVLNYETGMWEDRFKGKTEVMALEMYETEMERFRKEWSHTHWQMSRDMKNGQNT